MTRLRTCEVSVAWAPRPCVSNTASMGEAPMPRNSQIPTSSKSRFAPPMCTLASNYRLTQIASALTMHAFVALPGCSTELSGEPARFAHARTGAARSIPSEAKVVAEGNPPLSFLFQGGGFLYIYDETSDSLIHTSD